MIARLMVDDPNSDPARRAAARSKNSTSLIVLLVVMGVMCVFIFSQMRKGFQAFDTFQPNVEGLTPAVPGFP